ncbi:hypothetical protein D3C76_1214930 [compost metagenome]
MGSSGADRAVRPAAAGRRQRPPGSSGWHAVLSLHRQRSRRWQDHRATAGGYLQPPGPVRGKPAGGRQRAALRQPESRIEWRLRQGRPAADHHHPAEPDGSCRQCWREYGGSRSFRPGPEARRPRIPARPGCPERQGLRAVRRISEGRRPDLPALQRQQEGLFDGRGQRSSRSDLQDPLPQSC